MIDFGFIRFGPFFSKRGRGQTRGDTYNPVTDHVHSYFIVLVLINPLLSLYSAPEAQLREIHDLY